MKVYSGALNTANALAAGALGGFWTPTRRARLLELHITSAGTAITMSLLRTTARGTATNTNAPEGYDGNDETSAVNLDRSYSVDPTFSGNSLVEYSFPAANGQELVDWEFHPSALWIPAGAGLALKNTSGVTSQGHETFWVWEE